MEVPWQVLEKELLEKEKAFRKNIIRKWIIGGVSKGIIYSVVSAVGIILLYIFFDIYIRLEFILFMESGLFFLIGGMVGTHKTSLTLNSMLNAIFRTNFKQDGKTHEEGTHTVVYYSIVGLTLILMSLLVFFFESSLIELLPN